MKNSDNPSQSNRYFIPVDGNPVEVSEEVYRAYFQPVWNTRYHAQKHGECRCTRGQLKKCDGVCPGCPFVAAEFLLTLFHSIPHCMIAIPQAEQLARRCSLYGLKA